ncbi:MAG: aspartate/glutamate racemase family protein [Atribacterota bacterium]|nr:aspartate/glutamate racemase family protein [Atribacterota bacterium]
MKKKKTLVLIHNSMVLINQLNEICQQLISHIKVINLIDESLLRDIINLGKVNQKMIKRICFYVISSEEFGADAVMMTCSSLSETVDVAKNLVKISVLKIDEPMAIEAVNYAQNIGVIGTLRSVVGPSKRLIEMKAKEMNKKVNIESIVCEEAFNALIKGEKEKHNQLILQEANQIIKKVEIIVLAQGSMATFGPILASKTGLKVLTCLESGIRAAGKLLT